MDYTVCHLTRNNIIINYNIIVNQTFTAVNFKIEPIYLNHLSRKIESNHTNRHSIFYTYSHV